MRECECLFRSDSKQKLTFSNQNGEKCDIYHYIEENTDVTGEKKAAVEETGAAYRTERGRELWPHVAIFINKSMWQPSSHKTLWREGRRLHEPTEKDSGLPRLYFEQVIRKT